MSFVAFRRLHDLPICRGLCSIHSSAPAGHTSVDPTEIQKFSDLSQEWAEESGPFKALHSLNQLRVPWIVGNTHFPAGSAHLCDVGCGGGLLSIPLARAGYRITGLDATEAAIRAARTSLQARPTILSGVANRVSFRCTTVEDYAAQHANSFDAIVASEIVEHVASVPSFVEACVRLARPGAPLFFTTINRTLLSRIMAIWIAEDLLGLVPQGVHDWEKFVEPAELSEVLASNGCTVRSIQGFGYNPLVNEWKWIDSSAVNYAVVATKNL